MRQAGESVYGDRLRGLIVVLWRAGLRIHEALALAETDLEERRSTICFSGELMRSDPLRIKRIRKH